MGTLGCIHDMMRRDKENRELRQRDRERMKETRRRMTECRHTEIPPTLSVEKLEKIKKQTNLSLLCTTPLKNKKFNLFFINLQK